MVYTHVALILGWFYGPMSRVDAEKLLIHNPIGSFLVHDHVGASWYLLSFSQR